MRNYDRIDFSWNWRGDYEPGPNGDILDTDDDQIEALKQQIANIVRSSTGDWEFRPQLASDLEDFIGEKNSRETAQTMQKQLFAAIVEHANVAPGDLAIKIVPLTHDSVMAMIAIRALPTPNNSLDENFVRMNFIYSFGGRGVRI